MALALRVLRSTARVPRVYRALSAVPASAVKELRARTSAGMMDCKKALEACSGDMEEAIAYLRKHSANIVAKKAGRTASDGLVSVQVAGDASHAALVEVNSETDFVASNEMFVSFADMVSSMVLAQQKSQPADQEAALEALRAQPTPDSSSTVQEELHNLIAKVGENVLLRRMAVLSVEPGSAMVVPYIHNTVNPTCGKIGVVVAVAADDMPTPGTPAWDALATLGKRAAMQVAAAKPEFLDRSVVDTSALESEREVLVEQARASGKPEHIIEKMVTGRLDKYYKEVCLQEQEWMLGGVEGSAASAIATLGNQAGLENVRVVDFKSMVVGQ